MTKTKDFSLEKDCHIILILEESCLNVEIVPKASIAASIH